MTRPNWYRYYMNLAIAAASRATCPRRATGAVIVSYPTERVIATGYNGAPRGLPHCPTEDKAGSEECMEHGHCVRAVHAEINAIAACAAGGASTHRATLYCTTMPCHRCVGPIINAGIGMIVYEDEYADPSHQKNFNAISIGLARTAGIEVYALVGEELVRR